MTSRSKTSFQESHGVFTEWKEHPDILGPAGPLDFVFPLVKTSVDYVEERILNAQRRVDQLEIHHSWVEGELNYDRPATADFKRVRARGWIPFGDADASPGIRPLSFDEANAYAVALAKGTNPSRPLVSLPSFFGEMSQLPGQIYEVGVAKLFKKPTPRYPEPDSVGLQFGILPFISDLYKLLHFSDTFQKRARENNRLRDKGGARVRRTLLKEKRAFTYPLPRVMDSRLTGYHHVAESEHIWGVARWFPSNDFPLPPAGSEEYAAVMRNILLGVGPQKDAMGFLRDAWELLPWSWLSDWYGNIGDFLDANAGQNLARFKSCTIQRQLTSVQSFVTDKGTITLSTDSKTRTVGELAVTASLSPLTLRQQSILLGFAQRYGKPLRRGQANPGPGPVNGDPLG